MISVNKEAILNSTLKKRLIRGYDSLKKDYTQENAFAYKNLYENAELSEILEYSEYIFKEPYYGYNFYKTIMETAKIPPYKYTEELEKVSMYMESNETNMGDTQKSMYQTLVNALESMCEKESGRIRMSHFITENKIMEESAISDFYDAIYQNDTNKAESMLESMNDSEAILCFGIDCLMESSESLLYHKIMESVTSENDVEQIVLLSRAINTMQTLSRDTSVMESVSHSSNANLSLLLRGLSKESQIDQIESYTTERCDVYDPVYVSPVFSVNRIFEDDSYSEMRESEFTEEKINRYEKVKATYETGLEFILNDIYVSESPETELCKNNLVPNGYTLMEAVTYIGNKINEVDSYLVEFTNRGEATPVVRKSGTDLRETSTPLKKKNDDDDDDSSDDDSHGKKKTPKKDDGKPSDSELDFDDDDDEEDSNRKPEKPKQTLNNKLQQKGMDANMQFQKKMAEGKQKGQVVKNTVKAITKVPQSIINAFKNQIKHWDDMDDNRRKEYIIKPGNRKKIFSSFKLALYYYLPLAATGGGLAGTILKAKLLPLLFVIRHFSKDKNKRIRNELAMELDTEIKVCEEKINDANSNGDQKEKYQLMRIRDKLVAERTRVRSNSKYI